MASFCIGEVSRLGLSVPSRTGDTQSGGAQGIAQGSRDRGTNAKCFVSKLKITTDRPLLISGRHERSD
jgi:hypothetical protein